MKIAVGGGRRIRSRKRVFGKLDGFARSGDVIITGGAPGADRLAEEYARKRKLGLRVHPPDYGKHGKVARKKRNTLVVGEADVLIAFPGRSRRDGTYHAIGLARKAKKRLIIFEVGG